MEEQNSNQIPDSDRSSSDPEIDQTIQVRRVAELSNSIYENDLEEYAGEEHELLSPDYEIQSQYDAVSSWQAEREQDEQNIENEIESDRQAQSESSEPATLVTLYYAHNETETLIFPESPLTKENLPSSTIISDTNSKKRYRFTPASISKMTRPRSAPPMPLDDFDEFKNSNEYINLETAYMNSENLLIKSDGKIDFDSVEGHNASKKFLESIEKLSMAFGHKPFDRRYREKFTQAYKILYKENSNSLCYLTEILNSAQEGYPYIIVNSEKYIFSSNVLRSGDRLFYTFSRLKDLIKNSYQLYFSL